MPAYRPIVRRITAAVSVAAVLATVAPGPAVRANTTLTVNTTADDVDVTPADGSCATAAGKCSLRAAVQTVDALGYGNTIKIPAGTYTLTRPFDANDINGTFGDLDVVGSQTIIGAGSGKTIIQAGVTVNDAVDRVFDVRTDFVTVNFSGMTIRNGRGVNFGGGIEVSSTAVVSLTDVRLTGNRAVAGAGISGQGQLTISESVISGNTAGSAAGIDWAGNLTVRTTTVSGNTSTNALADGAIRFRRVPGAPGSTLLVDRSLISGNKGPVAAAVGIGEGNGDTSSAFIRNSTVTGNTATDAGATVIRVTAPAQLAFESATIASNASPAVKAPTKGLVTAKNSLFWHNGTKSCLSAITSLGHNLDGGTSCGLTRTSDRSNTNPRLGALGSNGGPTRTMALASNSPAIDAGAGCPSLDQRGQSRPKDGNGDGLKACDVGAYERKTVALVATPTPAPTATAAPSPTPLVTDAPSLTPSLEPSAAASAAPSAAATAVLTGSSVPAPTPVATSAPVLDASPGGGALAVGLLVSFLLVAVLVVVALSRRRSAGQPGVEEPPRAGT